MTQISLLYSVLQDVTYNILNPIPSCIFDTYTLSRWILHLNNSVGYIICLFWTSLATIVLEIFQGELGLFFLTFSSMGILGAYHTFALVAGEQRLISHDVSAIIQRASSWCIVSAHRRACIHTIFNSLAYFWNTSHPSSDTNQFLFSLPSSFHDRDSTPALKPEIHLFSQTTPLRS